LSFRVEVAHDHRLTAAEREVAQAILDGASNKEIAQQRGVAPRTVANQVASVFRKLGVSSRAELASTFAVLPGAI
jgi:DNA-binding CsgD family transcriptional regulator